MANSTTVISSPVQPSIPTVFYCDPGDVHRILTIEGVKLKLQDYGDGSVSGEVLALEDAIWEASETINYYCFCHYDPSQMVKSMWVNRQTAVIASYILSSRRGNSAPTSLEIRYNQALKWLEQIHSAQYELPGVPLRATAAPSWSNVRIDQRYPTYRVRVETKISEKTPASYDQSVDWSGAWDFNI